MGSRRRHRKKSTRSGGARERTPKAAIWLFDVPVPMDAHLSRMVQDANRSGNLTENQISVARIILGNPQHQVPRLPPILETHIRFSFITALFYQGLHEEGRRELDAARRAIPLSSPSPSKQDIKATQEILACLYSLGCFDVVDALATQPAVRAAIAGFNWDEKTRDSDALKIITTITHCKQLASGTESALRYLDRETAALRQQGAVHFYPEHLLRTVRHTVHLRGRDEALRAEALHFFAAFLRVTAEKINETPVRLLPSIVEILRQVTQGLLRSPATELPPWLDELARDGLRLHQWTQSLRPNQTRDLHSWWWYLVSLDPAVGVLLALTAPERARDRIASGVGRSNSAEKYIRTLPLHRRVDVFHQWTMTHHLAGCNPIGHVRSFTNVISEWRGACATYGARGVLRSTVAWQCNQVLNAARAWVGRATGAERARSVLALIEAEDVLGPARWLQERLAVTAPAHGPASGSRMRKRRPPYEVRGRLSTEDGSGESVLSRPAAVKNFQRAATATAREHVDGNQTDTITQRVRSADVLAVGSSAWPRIFAGEGEIWHLIPADDDLWWIRVRVTNAEPRLRIAHSAIERVSLVGVARRLRELHRSFLGSNGKVTDARRCASAARDADLQSEALQELDETIVRLSESMDQAIGSAGDFAAEVRGKDLLLVCADPRLLALPWGILPTNAGPLIQVARSFTINASIGATASAAALPNAHATHNSTTDLAAYCSPGLPGARLLWHEMFTADAGMTKVLAGRVDLYGDVGPANQLATPAAVERYPEDGECTALLVAGHGDPWRGIELVDGHWNPVDLESSTWQLRQTECAILPSCRLGEILWRDETHEDPSRNEVTGFMAGMLLRGLPRVIACPWVAFDKPLCEILPGVVARAEELRCDGSPHRWSRALRDTIVSSFGKQRPYDLANLVIFGAP